MVAPTEIGTRINRKVTVTTKPVSKTMTNYRLAKKTEDFQSKVNNLPDVENYLKNQCLAEKLALANFQLDKLKEELESIKMKRNKNLTEDINVQLPQSAENRGTLYHDIQCDMNIKEVIDKFNASKLKHVERNISETTVTQNMKKINYMGQDEKNVDQLEDPISLHSTQKAMEKLKETLEKVIPIIPNEAQAKSPLFVNHHEESLSIKPVYKRYRKDNTKKEMYRTKKMDEWKNKIKNESNAEEMREILHVDENAAEHVDPEQLNRISSDEIETSDRDHLRIPPEKMIPNGTDHSNISPDGIISNGGDHSRMSPNEIIPNGRDHSRLSPDEITPNGRDHSKTSPEENIPNGRNRTRISPDEIITNGRDHSRLTPDEIIPNGRDSSRISSEEIIYIGIDPSRIPSEEIIPNGTDHSRISSDEIIPNGNGSRRSEAGTRPKTIVSQRTSLGAMHNGSSGFEIENVEVPPEEKPDDERVFITAQSAGRDLNQTPLPLSFDDQVAQKIDENRKRRHQSVRLDHSYFKPKYESTRIPSDRKALRSPEQQSIRYRRRASAIGRPDVSEEFLFPNLNPSRDFTQPEFNSALNDNESRTLLDTGFNLGNTSLALHRDLEDTPISVPPDEVFRTETPGLYRIEDRSNRLPEHDSRIPTRENSRSQTNDTLRSGYLSDLSHENRRTQLPDRASQIDVVHDLPASENVSQRERNQEHTASRRSINDTSDELISGFISNISQYDIPSTPNNEMHDSNDTLISGYLSNIPQHEATRGHDANSRRVSTNIPKNQEHLSNRRATYVEANRSMPPQYEVPSIPDNGLHDSNDTLISGYLSNTSQYEAPSSNTDGNGAPSTNIPHSPFNRRETYAEARHNMAPQNGGNFNLAAQELNYGPRDYTVGVIDSPGSGNWYRLDSYHGTVETPSGNNDANGTPISRNTPHPPSNRRTTYAEVRHNGPPQIGENFNLAAQELNYGPRAHVINSPGPGKWYRLNQYYGSSESDESDHMEGENEAKVIPIAEYVENRTGVNDHGMEIMNSPGSERCYAPNVFYESMGNNNDMGNAPDIPPEALGNQRYFKEYPQREMIPPHKRHPSMPQNYNIQTNSRDEICSKSKLRSKSIPASYVSDKNEVNTSRFRPREYKIGSFVQKLPSEKGNNTVRRLTYPAYIIQPNAKLSTKPQFHNSLNMQVLPMNRREQNIRSKSMAMPLHSRRFYNELTPRRQTYDLNNKQIKIRNLYNEIMS